MKRYYKRNKGRLALVGSLHLLTAVSDVIRSFLLGSFVELAMTGTMAAVLRAALFTLLFLLLNAALDFFMRHPRRALIYRMGAQLRADLIRKVEALPWQEKQKQDDGFYLSLLSSDVETVETDYWGSIATLFWLVALALLSLGSALTLQPVVALVILGLSFLALLFPKSSERSIQRTKEAEQTAKAAHLSTASQLFRGFFLLKSFHRFGEADRVYDRANDTLREKKTGYSRINALVYALSYGWGGLIYLGTWVLGLVFVAMGGLTLPALVTLANLMDSVAGPVQTITQDYSTLVGGAAVKKRLLAFLDAPTDEAHLWGDAPLEQVAELHLSHFSLRTPDRLLLDRQDLTLRPGDRVALLGESGSGKSTLLRALAAMYSGEGEYTVNAVPFRSYCESSFRSRITLMEQKSLVFEASLRDNVTLFAPDAEDGQVVVALEKAGLSGWLALRGGNLDIPIGGGQQGFSGGEERRLDLARVLYRGGDVLLLDEPTTGLDTETRRAIEQVIAHLPCAILVVSVHDPSPEFLAAFNRVLTLSEATLREAPREP